MYKLSLTHSLTHSRTSLQQFSWSLLYHQIFTVYWIIPICIQTWYCNGSCLKFLCTSQATAPFLSNTSGSTEGNISLTYEGKCLYLLFQWLLSHSLFSPVYFSFHPMAALEVLSQIPRGLHMDQQHLTPSLVPSYLMYFLQKRDLARTKYSTCVAQLNW